MLFTLPQPVWNRDTTLADAFSRLVSAEGQQEALAAYDRLMYAVGNDHAGTYCPVILEVLPLLAETLRGNRPWPKFAALQALMDWHVSFWPEPGHEQVTMVGAPSVSLKTAVDDAIMAMRSDVERVVAEGGIAKDAAIEFLNNLED